MIFTIHVHPHINRFILFTCINFVFDIKSCFKSFNQHKKLIVLDLENWNEFDPELQDMFMEETRTLSGS